MNEELFTLLIIYRDGEEVKIDGVEAYGTLTNDRLFYYLKNGFRGFMPIDAVSFIGKANDYYE